MKKGRLAVDYYMVEIINEHGEALSCGKQLVADSRYIHYNLKYIHKSSVLTFYLI